MKRVIICGGRDFADSPLIRQCIAALPNNTVVVHGAARGADSVAASEAQRRGLVTEAHPADWATHRKAAGPIRNAEMLRSGADFVIAFPGGRGTFDMVTRARRAGLPVVDVSRSGTVDTFVATIRHLASVTSQ